MKTTPPIRVTGRIQVISTELSFKWIPLTSPNRNLLSNHATPDYTDAGANCMTYNTSGNHSPQVLPRRQDDRRDLRSVAPLGHERHRERLHENPEQHFEGAHLLLRPTGLWILHNLRLFIHLLRRKKSETWWRKRKYENKSIFEWRHPADSFFAKKRSAERNWKLNRPWIAELVLFVVLLNEPLFNR